MARVKAFSLVELLVIIAIVCILSTILFPVFQQATSRDEDNTSLGKALLVGQAVLAYTTDHDDVFPYGVGNSWWAPSDGGWVLNVQPYLGSLRKMLTPDDPQSKATWPTWMVTMPGAVNISFAANGYMRSDGAKWSVAGVMGMAQSSWIDPVVVSYPQVTHPADTVMLAHVWGAYPLYGTSDFFTGVDWYDTSGFGGLIPDYRRDGSAYLVNGVQFNADNRNGGFNALYHGYGHVVWVDGHASWVTPRSTNPRPADETRNKWWATRP